MVIDDCFLESLSLSSIMQKIKAKNAEYNFLNCLMKMALHRITRPREELPVFLSIVWKKIVIIGFVFFAYRGILFICKYLFLFFSIFFFFLKQDGEW